MRSNPRVELGRFAAAVSRLWRLWLAFAVGLGISAGLVVLAGAGPGAAVYAAVKGAFGTSYQTGETVLQISQLAVVALGAAVSLRAGLFSIGAPGQLQMGALAAAGVVLAVPHLATVLALPLAAVIAILAGAAWAVVPAALRAWRGVNEILSTLFMNYIAAEVLAYVLRTVLEQPGAPTPQSNELPAKSLVPNLWGGTRLDWAVILVPILALALAWWHRTPRGFALDVFGAEPSLGARMGVRPHSAIVTTLAVSGAAAGLAGWMEVAGVDHILYTSVGGNIGFNGILVAILGGNGTAGIVAAAVLFGTLTSLGTGLQFNTGIPPSIAEVVQGVIVLAVAVGIGRRLGMLVRRVPRRLIVDRRREESEPIRPVARVGDRL